MTSVWNAVSGLAIKSGLRCLNGTNSIGYEIV